MTPLTRLIYVEDEADIREIAQLALELVGGLQVEIYASGQEALKKAADFKPELMVLDVMMPGMDGPTTLAELRKNPGLATIPAIFMTAKVQPNEVAALLALGALDVVAKPFEPMTLAAKLSEIWERGHG